MTSPRQLSAQAKRLYRRAGAKDRFLSTYRPFICPFHVLLEYVPQGSRVLDVGCGSGLWLHLLWRSGRIRSATGFDLKTNKIRLAQAINGSEANLEFLCAASEEQWPDGPFDVVTIVDVLHHVPAARQREFLGRAAALEAQRIVLKDIDPRPRFKRAMNTLHDMVLSRQVPQYCPRERAAEWLGRTGYHVAENLRCDMLWYGHYLIVAEKGR